MLSIVVVAVSGWEWYLRKQGIPISYDNGDPLWADKRGQVYQPSSNATVFIGSSRIKYDLDIPTWESLTKTTAIQLACEGSNPNPVLQDLANDEQFKGNLVIDVTEGLFFSPQVGPTSERSTSVVQYFHKETPAQKAGFAINRALESQFVFLDQEDLSLPAILDQLPIPNRKGVRGGIFFPLDFSRTHFSRQSYMTDRFLSDTNISNKVTGIWSFYADMSKGHPPISGEPLHQLILTVKKCTDKIMARGGKVIFVRTPSSGPYQMGEEMGFPRKQYWDQLLAITGCKGIHYQDYPEMSHFVCPEWSHLAPKDAITFTQALVNAMGTNSGWSFAVK